MGNNKQEIEEEFQKLLEKNKIRGGSKRGGMELAPFLSALILLGTKLTTMKNKKGKSVLSDVLPRISSKPRGSRRSSKSGNSSRKSSRRTLGGFFDIDEQFENDKKNREGGDASTNVDMEKSKELIVEGGELDKEDMDMSGGMHHGMRRRRSKSPVKKAAVKKAAVEKRAAKKAAIEKRAAKKAVVEKRAAKKAAVEKPAKKKPAKRKQRHINNPL